MIIEFGQAQNSGRVDDFIDRCTKHFFNLATDLQPTLSVANENGLVSFFLFAEISSVSVASSDSPSNERCQFSRVAKGYIKNRSRLTHASEGWAIVTLAGTEYLTLQFGSEVYVRNVPKELSKSIVCRAKAEGKLLDLSPVASSQTSQSQTLFTLVSA